MTTSSQAIANKSGQAVAFFQQGNLRAALASAEGVLRESPHDAAMLELAAIAARRIGWMDDAIRHWTTLIDLNPDDDGLRIDLAELLLQAGRREDAAGVVRRLAAAMPGEVQACLQLAQLAMELGLAEEAGRLLDMAATQAPVDADVAFARGVHLQRTGRAVDAARCFQKAVSSRPDHAPALANLGLLCWVDDPAQAEAHFREAIRVQPQFASAYHHLGTLLHDRGRSDEGEQRLQQAVALQPGLAAALNDLGLLRRDLGRLADAESALRAALAAQPSFVPALMNLAVLLRQTGRVAEAMPLLQQAIALAPGLPAPLVNLALVSRDLGDRAAAVSAIERALVLAPADIDALFNRALLRRDLGDFTGAEADYERIIALDPSHAGAWINRALVLQRRGRHAQAEAVLREFLLAQPARTEALTVLGNVLMDVQRFDEAEAAFRRALELAPGDLSAGFNLGLLLLKRGRYAEGWPLFDLRNDPRRPEGAVSNVSLPFPAWRGEPLDGRAILLWYEQGLGDQLQFCRYAPLLKQRGAGRVALICAPALKSLLAGLAGADEVFSYSDSADLIAGFDYWSPLLSLPRYCGTTLEQLPATLPYLAAADAAVERWRHRLNAAPFRVGIAWRGNPAHVNDHNRSLPSLSLLRPLWEHDGVEFFSLQKGAGEDEARQAPPGQPMTVVSDDLEDFGETAALVVNLDLVITVDTATAHLAGALGVPCWVMLPYVGSDWRWLHDRDDSPWYPLVMRLFRQQRKGDWQPVVDAMRSALQTLVAAGGAGSVDAGEAHR